MNKIAFIFPGPGRQKVGMGQDYYDQFPEAREIFHQANQILDFDLSHLCFTGPKEELNQTQIAQLAVFTISMAIFAVLQSRKILPDIVIGYSTGECSAAVAAGVFSFKDGLKLLQRTGELIAAAEKKKPAAMVSFNAISKEQLDRICSTGRQRGRVEVAGYNYPGHAVIAGDKEAVKCAVRVAQEIGVTRIRFLPFYAPFHTSILLDVKKKLTKEFKQLNFSDPRIPIMSSVHAVYANQGSQIKKWIFDQVTQPIRWNMAMKKLIRDGVDTYVTIGPGRLFRIFMHQINKEVKIYSTESVKDLNILAKKLKT